MMGYDELSSKRIIAELTGGARIARPSPWPRRFLLALLALGVGGYVAMNADALQKITALSGAQTAGRGGPGRGTFQAPPVRLAVAELQDVPVSIRTIGTVLASSVVVVKSQIDGPLLSAHFKEGQMVKKGDILFRIDPAPFEATVRQNEAQVARDKAQLASAQADADRAVMLSERGIVSTQQRDQLVANAKALAATVQADEAVLERGKLNLGYTTIRSPINGKTGPYIVYPGNQVHANDQLGMITITEIQPVKITFNLPQGYLPRLQDRLREDDLMASASVRNELDASGRVSTPEMSIPVKVDFIGNTIDARTGTIELRATFANPDLRLVPGELVDVAVRLETLNQAVVVPHEAVNVGQSGPYVFVIGEDNKTQMRPVNLVHEDPLIAVLGSGVQAEERVVIDGQLRLTPGVTVFIVSGPGQTSSPGQTPPSPGQTPAEATVQKSTGPQAADPQATAPEGGGRRGAGRRGG